jgi:hypothetical protein
VNVTFYQLLPHFTLFDQLRKVVIIRSEISIHPRKMAAASGESNRQIKQMVNFIMQEAHEKVNEIRIKVLYSTLLYRSCDPTLINYLVDGS